MATLQPPTSRDKIFIAVVKKTFRYPNVFFYNRLYRNSLFRNFIMESGITSLKSAPQVQVKVRVVVNNMFPLNDVCSSYASRRMVLFLSANCLSK